MKKLLGTLLSPWLLVFVGLGAFAASIWWVGPLVTVGPYRPLDAETARWIVIGGVIGLYLVSKLLAAWRAWRTNRSVSKQLVAAPTDNPSTPETPEEKQLRERFDQALQLLRKARFAQDRRGLSTLSARVGKRYLYELPWYLIIGAPGSGKTTALLNAGLRFPLSATSGNKAGGGLAGVGGTRNCDWWFTDQAVLIDTAGRYTTQDSDAQGDKTAWQRFLDLLRRSRPRQPINGALVTVSIPDLLQQSAAERERQITAVRARVQELHQHFGVRFPVYLLVTKTDLVSGFVDYLGAVDKDTRATPWGFTFDKDMPASQRPAAFATEFDLLAARLNDGLIDRLQVEHDPARRGRIYGFPQQFAALRGVLAQVVDGVFAPSQFEQDVMLRGVYFVSGTQEGTPLDRIIGQVARSYQLERTPVPAHSGSARSFFLERLLQDVVFAESALGGTNLKWERRRGALALAGYATVAVLAVGLSALWSRSYLANRTYVADVAAKADKAQQLLTALPQTRADDLTAPLAALEAARLVAQPEGAAPNLNLGLGQQRKLEAAAGQTYHRLLGETWVPRLVSRLERQLAVSSTNPSMRYEMLKAYRMLHDPQHFDAKAFEAFVRADWAQMGNELNEAQSAAMDTHLATLLDDGSIAATTPENAAVVAGARASLIAVPLAQRIFTRVELLGVGEFPEFTLAKVGGPQTALVFTRTSGQPLTRGVPGMYTHDGYHKGFVVVADDIAKQLAAEEPWVLGVTDATRAPTVAAAAAAASRLTGRDPVFEEVRRLYLNKYTTTWDIFIRDLRVVPVRGLRDAIQAAQILGAPGGPLAPVMRALSKETTLAARPVGVVDKTKAEAGNLVQQGVSKIFDLTGNKPAAAAALATAPEVELVDSRFVALRDFVSAPGGQGPAPVDGSVALINEVYAHLNVVDAALQAKNAPPPSPVAAKVKNEAPRLPEPVKSMVVALNDAAQATSVRGLRDNLSDLIATEVGDFCRRATAGRYPFDRSSSRDVTPEDFARLFAAGGLFDATFQKHLAANVNTTTRPWSFRKIDGASLGAPGALVQFQRAAEIRDAYFRDGKPGMRLEFKPLELNATITQFTLDVDGQQLKYAHGPVVPATIAWPGTKGTNQVRMTIAPPAASGTTSVLSEGPWALLRMLDRQKVDLSATASEKASVSFSLEGRHIATYEVTSSSVQNPLRLKALQEFACPSGL